MDFITYIAIAWVCTVGERAGGTESLLIKNMFCDL